MSVSINIGDKINRLTVIGKSFIKNGRAYTPCKCDCGTVKQVREDALKSEERVSWNKQKLKWDAYIMKDRKKINLGRFEKKEDAILAREQGELKYYGFIKEI